MARFRCVSCGESFEEHTNFCKFCGGVVSEHIDDDTRNAASDTAEGMQESSFSQVEQLLGEIARRFMSLPKESYYVILTIAVSCTIGILMLLSGFGSNNPFSSAVSTTTPTRAEASSSSGTGAMIYLTPSSTPPVRTAIPTDVIKSESASNVNNNGLFAYHDDWLYFRTGRYMESADSTYGLYRVSVNRGDARLIYDGPNWYTNADENALYFVDHQRGRRLFRLDLQTEMTVALTDFQVRKALLAGDYIYGAIDGGGLFRVHKDGSEEPEVYTAISGTVSSLSESGGVIYFVDESNSQLLSIKEGVVSFHMSGVKKAIVQHNATYYISINDLLYKAELADFVPQLLVPQKVGSFVVSDGVIYFTNESENGHIYSVFTDGLYGGLLYDKPASGLSILNNRLFFINTEKDTGDVNDEFAPWCVYTDGSDGRSVESWMESMR